MTKIRRILCPTDFSPTARHAIDYALEMARSFGAEIVLLHVIPDMGYPLRSFGTVSAFPNLREEIHKRGTEELAELQAQLGTDVKITTELRDGASHHAILDCAKDVGADMIIIGTHGHTGLKHMLLGSTAEKVVRSAECPVLTVRSAAE
ncbi:MAG: universal stress protein [Planctomycetes bacterium]|nr:universal stress protein [Planctomycetota bacterium]MCB9883847.1 universal stress protein [Planctomycetota bacterium]